MKQKTNRGYRPNERGFTLIELMIVVAIVGILTSIAYPSYVSRIAKSRRADATAALMSAAQAMERYGSERATYVGATLGGSGIYPSTSSGGYYTLSLSSLTSTTYTITATATGGQASDKCGNFTYNQAGVKGVSGAGANAAACWNGSAP